MTLGRNPALIGIACTLKETASVSSFRIPASYVDGVRRAGANCILLPAPGDETEAERLLDPIDGLIIPGGADLPGEMFGEESHPSLYPVSRRRLDGDILLAQRAFDTGLPMLGICYGAQLIAVMRGGRLVQDIPSAIDDHLPHASGVVGVDAQHDVLIEDSSLLWGTVDAGAEVNSAHHQSILTPGDDMRVMARSSDGVVEAIESSDGSPVFGVQWHPERLGDQPLGDELLRRFVGICAETMTTVGFSETGRGSGSSPDD